MKVLMAVDGSDESLGAVNQVGGFLSVDGDEVVFYTRAPEIGPSGATSADRVAHVRELLAHAIVAEAKKQLPSRFRSQSILGTKDPRRGILLAAEQSAAELVVLGARGLGFLQRLLLGSVSRSVVHSSRIPVWVGRPKIADRKDFRVLVACHNAEAVLTSARLLSRFSWPASTSFLVLSAAASFYGAPVPEWLQQQARSPEVEEWAQRWAREHDEQMHTERARFQEIVGNLPVPLNKARISIMEGNPTELILTTITAEQSDLVVIGSHTQRPLVNSLLGSTAEAVLNHASCSVLVIPHQERP